MPQQLKYFLLLLILLLSVDTGYDVVEMKHLRLELETITLNPKSLNTIHQSSADLNYYTSSKIEVSDNIVNESLTSLAPKNISNFENKLEKNAINKNAPSLETKKEKTRLTLLRVVFENDIFDNTDYYYTNGMRIELITDFIANAPTSKILPTLNNSDYDYQGFSMVQNIYTPVNPDTKQINSYDRPFSAYLTIGHFRNSYNIEKGLSMKSEFSVGVLGPASLGGKVQSSIHEITPVGWENQIENDIVIDYSFQIEKAILRKKYFEASANAGARAGTVYNNLSGGLSARTGFFLPVLDNQLPGLLKFGSEKLKFWFFAKAKLQFVVYDATLQGGIFNNSSFYVLDAHDLNRFVISASAGLAIYHKNVGLELENFYLSPEFKGAYDFRYGRINFVISL